MYNTGDKPGAGKYECTNCGYIVELNGESDELPACPQCGNKTFKKID